MTRRSKLVSLKVADGEYDGFDQLDDLDDGIEELSQAISEMSALRRRLKKRRSSRALVQSLAIAMVEEAFREKAIFYIDKWSKEHGDVTVSFRWSGMDFECHGSLKTEVADLVESMRGDERASDHAKIVRDCFISLASMLDELIE